MCKKTHSSNQQINSTKGSDIAENQYLTYTVRSCSEFAGLSLPVKAFTEEPAFNIICL